MLENPGTPLKLAALLILLALRGATAPAAESEKEWRQVRAIVERHFRENVQYQRGDLISRGDVEPIFNELLDLGLQSTDEVEEMYDSFLTDSHPLVTTLRTVPGRKFMRQVSAVPGAYDRLERLLWFPSGQEWLDELVRHPEGPRLFRVLISPEGAKKIEQLMKDDPRARNFGLPTGRLHTAEALLKHLKQQTAP